MIISVGNTGLYLAHNCPDHTEIRITGVRITDGPLYYRFVKVA
jgi:hypothetical protein